MEAPSAFKIRILGRVQGVGFRYAAYKEAVRRGIRGFVRNERDGSVYMEVEGSREILDAFTEWCRKGFLGAHVEKVITEEAPVRGFQKFEIQSLI
ncbi:MAG: acylphosphatase [Candidatus Liptonbacteria bacterium]|nr:acylphosphatase [Candidatus Liptonbacteria bacterium]